MKQLTLDMGLAPSPTLARFVPGGNAAALAHLQTLAAGQAPSATGSSAAPLVPTYLWGAAGSGKTHLLRALGEALRERGAMLGWMDTHTPFPAAFDGRWSAMLLDDVHTYSARQQARAFSWFNDAADGAPRLLLAAARVPPVDLPLREDLRSRLGWGDVFRLQLLREDERRAVLLREARARGMALGEKPIDEVLDYMLHHFARDLHSLMQTLARLDAFALRSKRAINLALLREMLREPLNQPLRQAGAAVLDGLQGTKRSRSGAAASICNAADHQNPATPAAQGLVQSFLKDGA